MACLSFRPWRALVAGWRLFGAEVGAARALQEVAAEGRQVAQLGRGRLEDGLGQHRVILHDCGVLGSIVQLDQRADAQRSASQRLDPLELGDTRDIDDALQRHDPEPHPVQEFGAARQKHGAGVGAEGDRLVRTVGARVSEGVHQPALPLAAAAAFTASTICG